jgi:hypothetical protein
VVETEQVAHLHTPRIAWFYDQTGDTNIANAKIRLNIAADGHTATGLMGGYRNWRDLYAEDTFAQDGGQQGTREHEDAVSLYYALRRNADGMYNEKTGKFDGISMAYRLRMSSAFVVDPDKPMEIAKQPEEEGRKAAFEGIKQAVIRGADARVPQAVPAGTTEGSYPALEHEMDGLPSREYFLKTLDRPHYANEKPEPKAPQAPKQQVRNGEERVAIKNE